MGLDGTIYVLSDTGNNAGAEIWPALGFNCYHWQAPWKNKVLDLLYADPQMFVGAKPSRSGIPVLFPFPNRIRDGRYSWKGKDYQLALNDSASKNAIHGWVCRHPWRVVEQGADDASAWLVGEFRASLEAPESRSLWPADYQLRLTYRLTERRLRLEATVSNPDSTPLPFGLAYHPYFQVPFVAGSQEADYWVESSAREYWELRDNLPTGKRKPVDASRDLTKGKHVTELSLDDVLSDMEGAPPAQADALCWRGSVRLGPAGVGVEVLTSPAFRELVVFTPANRQAVCLEPYTCTSDAINLQQRGIDAGLLVLDPGAQWHGTVELAIVQDEE